jgi:hypothetical protein
MQGWANTVANLQLLEGQLNKEKNATLPLAWLKTSFESKVSRKNYCNLHALGDVPKDLTDFTTFVEARYERLYSRLSKELN